MKICDICVNFLADVLISHGLHGLHILFWFDFLLLDSSVGICGIRVTLIVAIDDPVDGIVDIISIEVD